MHKSVIVLLILSTVMCSLVAAYPQNPQGPCGPPPNGPPPNGPPPSGPPPSGGPPRGARGSGPCGPPPNGARPSTTTAASTG